MKNWLAKCILLAAALLTVPFTLRADSFADTGDDAIVAVPLTTYSYTIDFGSTPTYVTPQLVMSNLGISRLWGNAVWNSPDGEDNGATELDRKGGNAELVSGDWDGVTLFIKGDFITLGGTWYMSGSNGARGGDGGDVVGSGPRAGEGGNASGGGNGGSLLVTTRRLGIDTSQQGHFSFVSDGGDGGEGGAGGNAWGDFDCPGGGAIKALGGDGGNGADGGDNGVLYVQTCYPLSNEQLEYLSSMTVTSGDGGDGGLAGGPLQVSIASYGDPGYGGDGGKMGTARSSLVTAAAGVVGTGGLNMSGGIKSCDPTAYWNMHEREGEDGSGYATRGGGLHTMDCISCGWDDCATPGALSTLTCGQQAYVDVLHWQDDYVIPGGHGGKDGYQERVYKFTAQKGFTLIRTSFGGDVAIGTCGDLDSLAYVDTRGFESDVDIVVKTDPGSDYRVTFQNGPEDVSCTAPGTGLPTVLVDCANQLVPSADCSAGYYLWDGETNLTNLAFPPVPCLAAETAEDLTSHVYELQLATDRSLSARMADFDLGYQGSAIYRLDTGALLACDWTIAGRPAEAFYTNTTGSAIDLAVLNSHHTGSYSWHAAMHEFYLVEDGTTPGTWTQGVGTGGTMGSYFDTSLQSSVVQLTDNDTCGSRFDTAIDKGGVPCISLYYKKNYQCGSSNTIAVLLDTTSGWRWASYRFGTGTPYYDSANLTYFFYVGSLGTGQWHLLNRNMQQDLTSLSGPTITHTIGMSVWGQDMSVDDIRASACLRP